MHSLVVEPTHLKNISQIGSFPQVGVKIKNIWNHHPDHLAGKRNFPNGSFIWMNSHHSKGQSELHARNPTFEEYILQNNIPPKNLHIPVMYTSVTWYMFFQGFMSRILKESHLEKSFYQIRILDMSSMVVSGSPNRW